MLSLRPDFRQMGRRLASSGYVVLVPNVYYRSRRAPVVDGGFNFANPEDRAKLTPFRTLLTPEAVDRDAAAYLAFLDARPQTDRRKKIGVQGYCMGGPLTFRTAAVAPQRVAAAASFHGGGLAPDEPDAPSAGAPRIRGEVYAGHADADPSMPPEQVERLERALTDAGVPHTCEVYAGAPHGFTMSDMPVHDAAAEQRHWDALLDLLERRLPVRS